MRSIPAHAGETNRYRYRSRDDQVDPRSRGGDLFAKCPVMCIMGRSPLTRGRRSEGVTEAPRLGSIPAHAGETTAALPRRRCARVDPRSRGGDARLQRLMRRLRGRSPLTRGRRRGRDAGLAGCGSIPAHAGETSRSRVPQPSAQVDPRSRGGDRRGFCLRRECQGRSPLTRGRLFEIGTSGPSPGSIPAHAGETLDHKRLTALVISIFKEPVRRQDAALRDSRRPSTSTNSTGGLPSVRMA